MKHETNRMDLGVAARMGLAPILFYGFCFAALTFPLIRSFSTDFFADTGDGLQNVWNMWWVRFAVLHEHALPWHTTFLHFPHGTSLLGHTLNPFNGFAAIGLRNFLTLLQAHNAMVVFSFVAGGFGAFLLAYCFTGAYAASLLGGFIFTFSNYHFAHAEGHLQLVSLEWIPFFLLCWFDGLERPKIWKGILQALTLFLVLLCDYYYFFYCVLTAIVMVCWQGYRRKNILFLFEPAHRAPFGVFLAAAAVSSAPLVISLIALSLRDPFFGAHDPRMYSLDALAPFIPGGHWRFHEWTRWYWSKLPGNIHETSVHIGLSIAIVIAYAWIKRRSAGTAHLTMWFLILVFFGVLSLGPRLHVWGAEVPELRLPYALFEFVFPPLRISGVPVRMMVMVTLSAAVISAYGFNLLFRLPIRYIWAAFLLVILMLIEYLPKAMPRTNVMTPDYVTKLKSLPHDKGLLDFRTPPTLALYYQTIHERPMASGYISRIPASVAYKTEDVFRRAEAGDYLTLCREYDFRYVLVNAGEKAPPAGDVLYEGRGVRLYDLGDPCIE